MLMNKRYTELNFFNASKHDYLNELKFNDKYANFQQKLLNMCFYFQVMCYR